jgi:hypothetical protein
VSKRSSDESHQTPPFYCAPTNAGDPDAVEQRKMTVTLTSVIGIALGPERRGRERAREREAVRALALAQLDERAHRRPLALARDVVERALRVARTRAGATRVAVGGSAGTPIPGFVLSGTGTRTMLLRAVGPGLAPFGVGGVLTDPRFDLVTGTTTLAANDNWLSADAATLRLSLSLVCTRFPRTDFAF